MQQETGAAEIRWPNAIWAWEFLRRNQDYRQAFENHRDHGPKQTLLPSGSRLFVGDARYEAARDWGLLYFANPKLSAYEAGVFWKPSLFAATIPVSLRDPEREKDRERYAGSDDMDMVILSELCCRRLIFESVNQSRHVRLAPRRFWIQLYCDSSYPLDDNALINFRIEGAKHAQKRIASIQQLIRLHNSTGRKLRTIGYRKNPERLGQALTALDIKAAGGSYRDIARTVFGINETNRDWSGGHSPLKQIARRALERGRLYRDGKYLELLS